MSLFIYLFYFTVGKWYWWLWKSRQNTSQRKEIWGSSDICSTRGTKFLCRITVFQRLSNNLQHKIYCINKSMNLPLNLIWILHQTANCGSFAWIRTFAYPGAATDCEFQTVKGIHEEHRWLRMRKHWLLITVWNVSQISTQKMSIGWNCFSEQCQMLCTVWKSNVFKASFDARIWSMKNADNIMILYTYWNSYTISPTTLNLKTSFLLLHCSRERSGTLSVHKILMLINKASTSTSWNKPEVAYKLWTNHTWKFYFVYRTRH